MNTRRMIHYPSFMERRRLLLTSLAVIVASPFTATAQRGPRVPRVGLISEGAPGGFATSLLETFRAGLRDLGYVEGQNVAIEHRSAKGTPDRFRALAAELVNSDVDVLVVGGTIAARAAMSVTKRVPIVFTLAGDPVGSGLVATLTRPGGNVTGLTNVNVELGGKQLELLKAAVPHAGRIAVLYNPLNPAAQLSPQRLAEAARLLGVELHFLEVRKPAENEAAFAAAVTWQARAALVIGDTVFGDVTQLAGLATKHRLPTLSSLSAFAQAGGLMGYGANLADNFRRAATYVDKILKGAKPGELPVEQPTKFELAINLKTARTLGVAISPSLQARADTLIQ
ncbi:MAG TPA: ABC transporter substrate-binding protein [Methylomirabilota bacterium]|nr:ABC transporter substrate-binding protein [Methylomirabilota bacterium]